MKRTLLAIISTFALFAQFATAQTSTQDFSKASVVIKFSDRTMYNTASAADNPVNVNVSIVNNGTETLRFKLADDRMFSVDFEAYTLKNTALAQTKDLIKKRSTNQTVYFREIAIEPGESYSFIENVKNYISFDEPSVYYFEAVFYPELYKSRKLELTSNRLSIDIRPAPSAASSTSIPVEAKTGSILKPESISPDKVIEQTIVARQRSLWDQYFLYMDLQEMLIRNADTARRFRNASADERRRMVEAYKTDLMQNRIDQDIVAVPETFEIEKTSYSATNGEVKVIEWFTYPTFKEKKRFTYKVRQRDGIWQIYDYTVENLGTEK
ncbi:ABC transporter substrate-binding protein [Treponema zioleckii]|uniref:ABC transporter substrate-binding protein n=1 Tax=Treponema zioleckii TaxID=331680 RepID=UPI00168B14A6|nr:ABC transporter substrate-binding protein [Treponema zioleckii]